MSSTTTLAKVAGAGSLAGAAGLAVVAAATPALAATECPVGSTDIGSGVCEVKLTASGS